MKTLAWLMPLSWVLAVVLTVAAPRSRAITPRMRAEYLIHAALAVGFPLALAIRARRRRNAPWRTLLPPTSRP